MNLVYLSCSGEKMYNMASNYNFMLLFLNLRKCSDYAHQSFKSR